MFGQSRRGYILAVFLFCSHGYSSEPSVQRRTSNPVALASAALHQIVPLLNQMRRRIQEQSSFQERSHSAFFSWCSQAQALQSTTVEASHVKLASLHEQILRGRSQSVSQNARLASLDGDIQDGKKSLSSAAKMREQEHAVSRHQVEEFDSLIRGVELGISKLRSTALSLPQLQSVSDAVRVSVSKVLGGWIEESSPSSEEAGAHAPSAILDARFLRQLVGVNNSLLSFTASQLTEGNPAAQLLDSLEKLKTDLRSRLDEIEQREEKQQGAYQGLWESKSKEIVAGQSESQRLSLEYSQAQVQIQRDTKDWSDSQALFLESEQFLAGLKAVCANRGHNDADNAALRIHQLSLLDEASQQISADEALLGMSDSSKAAQPVSFLQRAATRLSQIAEEDALMAQLASPLGQSANLTAIIDEATSAAQSEAPSLRATPRVDPPIRLQHWLEGATEKLRRSGDEQLRGLVDKVKSLLQAKSHATGINSNQLTESTQRVLESLRALRAENDRYRQWCNISAADTLQELSDMDLEEENLKLRLTSASEQSRSATGEVQSLRASLQELSTQRQNAEAARRTEKAAAASQHSELSEMLTATQKAITVLGMVYPQIPSLSKTDFQDSNGNAKHLYKLIGMLQDLHSAIDKQVGLDVSVEAAAAKSFEDVVSHGYGFASIIRQRRFAFLSTVTASLEGSAEDTESDFEDFEDTHDAVLAKNKALVKSCQSFLARYSHEQELLDEDVQQVLALQPLLQGIDH